METTCKIDPMGVVMENVPGIENCEAIPTDVHHFHYGVRLLQHTPTTGVYGGNQLDWEYMPSDWIDLDVERWIEEAAKEHGEDTDEYDEALQFMEGGETLLLGSWEKVDGKYGANKDTDDPEDFAAIYNSNENTLQVVWSKVIAFGQLASPCYPGQVSANTDDPDTVQEDYNQAYYALPSGCLYTEAKYQRDRIQIAVYEAQRNAQRQIDEENVRRAAAGLDEI